jgi:hypothetical protein
MTALSYVGVVPAAFSDIATQDSVAAAVASNRTQVEGLVSTAVATKATVAAVQQKMATYAAESEYKTKDTTRNVPLTSVNVANAPVALQNDGTIASTLFTAMGAGYLYGPWVPGTVTKATAVGVSPVAVTTFTTTAIPAGFLYRPMCFATLLVKSSGTAGRPLVEIRLGTTASGTLVAIGRGRTMFTGLQSVAVMPVADTSAWLTSTGAAVTVTVWLSDTAGVPVSMDTAGDMTGAAYILAAPAV